MTNIEVEIERNMLTSEQSPDNLKDMLISGIMELSYDERKELLAMWKGRKANEEVFY